MTSDEKKTTKTFVLKPILVGEKKIFFFDQSWIFREKSKKKKSEIDSKKKTQGKKNKIKMAQKGV